MESREIGVGWDHPKLLGFLCFDTQVRCSAGVSSLLPALPPSSTSEGDLEILQSNVDKIALRQPTVSFSI